jgi:hypothetical protein
MRSPFSLGALLGFCLAVWSSPGAASTPFVKAFDEKYVKDHPSETFRTAFKKTRCDVCHVKGKPKTVHNAYGDELAKFIEGSVHERLKAARAENRLKEEEQQLLVELEKAFGEVEKIKIDPADAASPTYGEKIRGGELPAAAQVDDDGTEE